MLLSFVIFLLVNRKQRWFTKETWLKRGGDDALLWGIAVWPIGLIVMFCYGLWMKYMPSDKE